MGNSVGLDQLTSKQPADLYLHSSNKDYSIQYGKGDYTDIRQNGEIEICIAWTYGLSFAYYDCLILDSSHSSVVLKAGILYPPPPAERLLPV